MSAVIEIVSSDDEDDVVEVRRGPSAVRFVDQVLLLDDSDSGNDGPARKRAKSEVVDLLVHSKTSPVDEPAVKVVRTMALPPSPLEQVLCVFPDLELKFAHTLLGKHNNVAANAISELAEASSYPKQPGKSAKRATGTAITCTEDVNPRLDFFSPSCFEPDSSYINQSLDQLRRDFVFLSKKGAKTLLSLGKNHYAITYSNIVRAITGSDNVTKMGNDEIDDNTYQDCKALLFENKIPLDAKYMQRMQKAFGDPTAARTDNFMKTHGKQLGAAPVTNEILKEEITVVRNKLDEWINERNTEIRYKVEREMAVAGGSAMDCPCCYDSVSWDELVQCRNGHLLCRECLANYVSTKVFSDGGFGVNPITKESFTELTCFQGEGCSQGFDRSCLVKALKKKVLARYDELEYQVSLERAGLKDDICVCPKCGFAAELAKSQNIFSCPSCAFESCRHCREESHIPLKCSEVENKNEAAARARVEEAATAAVIRSCPKCKKAIVKQEGCNKMTCACGAKFCYLCHAVVKDYTHFCQIAHCTHKSCTNCPLYTKDLDALHAEAAREAAKAEAAKVEAESTKATLQTKKRGLFTQEDEKVAKSTKIHVDVDSILQAPRRR